MKLALAGLSMRSTGYVWRLVHDEFVVEEVALRRVFDRAFRSFSVNVTRAVHRTRRFFYHRRSKVLEITLNITCVSRQRNRATAQEVSAVSITKTSGLSLEHLKWSIVLPYMEETMDRKVLSHYACLQRFDFVWGLFIKKVHDILQAVVE